MTLVDTLFVGRLGAASLAGVGVGGIFAFTLLCFGFGALRSVKVLVSQAVGAQQQHRIVGFIGAGLSLALLLGLTNLALGWLLSPLLSLVTATEASGALAERYADLRVVGAPFVLVAVALRESRYGRGDAQTPMRATLVANVVNIVLDYLFIVELELGVAGAAWASVAAQLVDAALLVLVQRSEGFGLGRSGWRELRALWRLGVPIGLQMLLEVCAFALLTGMLARLGELDVAAHQIALQAVHFSFLPAFALGEAASVLTGQAVGAREEQLVPKLAFQAMLLTGVYTGLCGLVFAFAGEAIGAAFTDDGALVALVADLLLVAAAFQVFDGANIVARCVLRGAGDVRFAAWVAVTLAWLATPPLTLALGYAMGLGAVGGWIGLCLEIVLGAAVLWWRLLGGGWRAVLARERSSSDERRRLQTQPVGG
jgi:MATE family multidrug resistance protein